MPWNSLLVDNGQRKQILDTVQLCALALSNKQWKKMERQQTDHGVMWHFDGR